MIGVQVEDALIRAQVQVEDALIRDETMSSERRECYISAFNVILYDGAA